MEVVKMNHHGDKENTMKDKEIKVKWNEDRPSDIPDKINPPHYQQGNIEVIDFILDQKMDYLTGTVTKYISRWRFKDGVCDLKKARWFLDKLIEKEEKISGVPLKGK